MSSATVDHYKVSVTARSTYPPIQRLCELSTLLATLDLAHAIHQPFVLAVPGSLNLVASLESVRWSRFKPGYTLAR
jgi:hypothetical protein